MDSFHGAVENKTSGKEWIPLACLFFYRMVDYLDGANICNCTMFY